MRYLLLFIGIFLFSYELIVKDSNSVVKLRDIGINCIKKKEFYSCINSNDLNRLKQQKDFLKKEYHIEAYIIGPHKSIYKKEIGKNSKIDYKSKYCIQIATYTSLKEAKTVYEKYKNLPFLRIEKIGKFYVLRTGFDNYNNILKIYDSVNKGLIRSCVLKKDRIVKSNFNIFKVKNLEKKELVNNKKDILNSNDITIKSVYYYLNNGNLIYAEKYAKKFLNSNKKDAYYVLGIVYMKKNDWEKSCHYFTKLSYIKNNENINKLKNNSCSIYYLKKGFNNLGKSPEKAYKFFVKSDSLKSSVDAKIGKVYALINLREYDRALNLVKSILKKYPGNRKLILALAQIYNAKSEFKKVEELGKKYPYILKSNVMFDTKLKKAQYLIKEKKYDEAEELLIDLYKKNPSNINLLLTLGNLYLNTNQLNKAEAFYKNAFLISDKSYYALKGLEAVYIKKQNYQKALYYSNKLIALGYKDENRRLIKDNLYLQKAKFYIKKNDYSKAKNYLLKISESNIDRYLLLGDIYAKQNKKSEAYKYYSYAYKLNPNNFNIKIKFLYSLLNLNLYEQIKLLLEDINYSSLTKYQKEKLSKFYNDLYLKYSSYLLNQKEYKKALFVANKGLKFDFNNYKLFSIKGWSCYNLEKYDCARESFEKYLNYEPRDEVKYALSLTYIKLHKFSKAKSLLDSIHTDNKTLKINISEAYALIGETKKSKVLLEDYKKDKDKANDNNDLLDIFDFDEKKKLNKNIKILKIEKLIEEQNAKNTSFLSFGLYIRNKSGNSGTSQLVYLSPFIGVNLKNNSFEFYSRLYSVNLYSGDLDDYSKVGTKGNNVINEFITNDNVFYPEIGFKIKKDAIIDFKLSSSGIGAKSKINPTYNGHIKFIFFDANTQLDFTLYRESIKDSLTSFIGNKDPYSNKKWGRVVANGFLYEYTKSLDKNDSMFYLNFDYAILNGVNVDNNYKIDFTLFPLWYIGSRFLDQDYLGVYFNFENYKEDQNKFIYRKGGYFSPKFFLLIGPRYEGYYNGNNYLLKAFFYPALNIQSNNSGLYFDGALSFVNLLNDNFQIETGTDIRFSNNYNDFILFINFKYLLDKKTSIFKEEVDKILKKVSKW